MASLERWPSLLTTHRTDVRARVHDGAPEGTQESILWWKLAQDPHTVAPRDLISHWKRHQSYPAQGQLTHVLESHCLRVSRVSVTGPTKQLSKHVTSVLGLSSNDNYKGNEADIVEFSQTMVRD